MNTYLNYWEDYYKNNQDPGEESPFARFVLPFLKKNETLYELGCGNGRDSIFFEKFGVNIVAFDQCKNEVEYLNKHYKTEYLSFEEADFTNLGERQLVAHIYSRFTLHSVNLEQEIRTLKWAYRALKERGLFYIEIRSIHDELFGKGEALTDNSFVTDHYRRFVEFDSFVSRLESAGFKVLYKLQSKGLAVYKSEDPIVIRVVVQK